MRTAVCAGAELREIGVRVVEDADMGHPPRAPDYTSARLSNADQMADITFVGRGRAVSGQI